jgi:hypothetical protein
VKLEPAGVYRLKIITGKENEQHLLKEEMKLFSRRYQ